MTDSAVFRDSSGNTFRDASGAVTNFPTSGSGAPADATYITQTTNGTLSAEQALAALATGMLKVTTTTGVLSTGTEGTDYWKPGGTDVAVADGGTGASTAGGARTNLGLVINTDVEAHDADLTTIAGLTPTNDDLIQRKAGAWTNRTPAQYVADIIGTSGSTVAVGNDSRLSDSRAPNGSASGSLAGSYPSPRIAHGKTGERTLMQSLVTTCLAESFPRWAINSNTGLLSSARLSSVAIPVLQGTPCTSVSFVQATTAFSGAANAWFALADSSFVPIRQSTDQLTAGIAQNTLATLAMDSIPVTAGARVASTTVTLTFPTLSESLTSLIAPGDSVVVANANVAAYNGTFTVVSVTSTQITYVSGGSATDSLVAPFPTVKLAAGKRVYTAPADALVYAVIMLKGTVGTLGCYNGISAAIVGSLTPILASSGNTGLTGTCPSPVQTGTTGNVFPWAAIS